MSARGKATAALRHRRRGVARPRVILLWCAAAIAVALGLSALAPWILPVRIYEGPLVQLPAEDGATLVWFTTRAAECTLELTVDNAARAIPIESQGSRHVARVAGLAPGTRYPYVIRAGTRALTRDLAFATNRRAGERFTFLVFGDSGRRTRVQYLLASQMNVVQPAPDLVLHTGDVVYPSGSRDDYEASFFAPYRHLLARVPFFPSLGNHDVGTPALGVPYREVFELPRNGPADQEPENHYWFDYAAARFAVLDSNVGETVLGATVAPWLRDTLAAAGERWRFVVLHHPPYTGGHYAPDAGVQRSLVPVFDEGGVDVVFSGHDHMYQRTHPLRGGAVVPAAEGVVYVISGAGGARLYDPADVRPAYIASLHNEVHSFTLVTVDGDMLTLRQLALGGEVLDEFTRTRRARSPATASAPASAPAGSAPPASR